MLEIGRRDTVKLNTKELILQGLQDLAGINKETINVNRSTVIRDVQN